MNETHGIPSETPLADQRRMALEHYERVSLSACSWHSDIPRAINFYYDAEEAKRAATRCARCGTTEGKLWSNNDGKVWRCLDFAACDRRLGPAPSSPSPVAGSETRCPGCGGRGYRTGRQGRYNCPRCRGDGMVSSPASERPQHEAIQRIADGLARSGAEIVFTAPASERRGEPMTEERLAEIRENLARRPSASLWAFNAANDLLREVARLRSTGEPSPDLAALLDKLQRYAQASGRAEAAGVHPDALANNAIRERAARAALDRALASLQADRVKYKRLREAVNDSPQECGPDCNRYGHGDSCPSCDPAIWLERQQETIRSLQAEQERAARDAERYRFLRRENAEVEWSGPATWRVVVSENDGNQGYTGDTLDAAVDAAARASLRGEPTTTETKDA